MKLDAFYAATKIMEDIEYLRSVLATYRECKTIVGNVYTEQEFQKYITSL